jgi:hypothetical protein
VCNWGLLCAPIALAESVKRSKGQCRRADPLSPTLPQRNETSTLDCGRAECCSDRDAGSLPFASPEPTGRTRPSPMRFGFRHGRGREYQHDRNGVGARPPTVPTPSASALRRESSLDRRRGLATDHPAVVGARRHPAGRPDRVRDERDVRERQDRDHPGQAQHRPRQPVDVAASERGAVVVGILTARLPLAIPMTRPREARRWPAKRASARGVRFQNASTSAENSLSHRCAIPTRSCKNSCFAGFLRERRGRDSNPRWSLTPILA